MSQFLLQLKDESKKAFLLELLGAFTFVEVRSTVEPFGANPPSTFGEAVDGLPGSVTYDDVEEGYRAMAADQDREREATAWIEGTLDGE